ncbi:hypothetical protein [Saccharopolyspora mangrovi]|uniref:Uncharacterized protein n=1 Tax=Saccharopolyspora mangrovi TaxID=3082379 RepID=A0ABU6A6J5_9PSEU|nr:hypothetical protein [Saccharopolyspora sp. S2-29]MEB3367082.1 hypothetical protein [Saccharopolyspora sp. S2-29]
MSIDARFACGSRGPAGSGPCDVFSHHTGRDAMAPAGVTVVVVR